MQAFLARWDEVNAIVHGLVIALKGSISAEHGIGQLKRDLLPKVKDKVAMEVMRAIKKTLDPKNILKPGKFLDLVVAAFAGRLYSCSSAKMAL